MTDGPSSDEAEARWLGWVDRFSVVLAALAGIATALMMANVIADVIGREFFNHPLPGTLDLTQYVWMPSLVALGLGYALLRGEHIRESLLTGPTGERTQRGVEIVGMVFTLVVVGLFIWFGFEKAQASIASGESAIGTEWLAIWPYRLVLLVGLSGLFLQSLAQLVRAVTSSEFVPSDEVEAIELLEEELELLEAAALPDELNDELQTPHVEVQR